LCLRLSAQRAIAKKADCKDKAHTSNKGIHFIFRVVMKLRAALGRLWCDLMDCQNFDHHQGKIHTAGHKDMLIELNRINLIMQTIKALNFQKNSPVLLIISGKHPYLCANQMVNPNG
jgi:hypothetical protein